jgi:iron complex transport system ATP-binding protein
VQVARALAQQPRLLLLDEPTSHLDIAAQLFVMETLTRRAATGATVLVALHDLNLAARYCDHLVLLRAGRVDAEGRPADILDAGRIRRVYGVEVEVLALPRRPYPTVIYDHALPHNPIDIAVPSSKL